MSIGRNVKMKDRVLKTTAVEKEKKKIERKKITEGTSKQTFYVKDDLLDKFYNYCYWDRKKVTEGFNEIFRDGLKGKRVTR